MKKIYLLIAAMLVMALAAGCASSAKSTSSNTKSSQAAGKQAVPDWIAELPPSDAIWGVGRAKLTDESLAMETAETRAQRSAARQMGALVQGMLTDYLSESGTSTNPRALVAIENIGKNIVNMDLQFAEINNRTRMSDGTWFYRVSVSKTRAVRQAASIIDNEVADYAEFKSFKAQNRLQAEIDKMKTKPSEFVVDE